MPELTRPPLRPSRRWRIRRPVPYWAAATVAALTTAGVVAHLANGAAAAEERWSPAPAVLVVRHEIPAGAPVLQRDVEARRLPRLALPSGAIAVLPPGARAVVALHPGEVVLRDRVSRRSRIAAMLPTGTRGIAVPNDTALPVRVGDRIDVLATFDAEVAAEAPTFAVARDALVVHVDRDAVTVAVLETSAPKVAYALAAGAVTLVLSGTSSRR